MDDRDLQVGMAACTGMVMPLACAVPGTKVVCEQPLMGNRGSQRPKEIFWAGYPSGDNVVQSGLLKGEW